MKELVLGRLGQIMQRLENVERVTDDKGSKYIQISDNAAKYIVREMKFVSGYIAKDDRHKQSDE